MISNYDDYREYLLSIMNERASRNARYSLRAFARDLDIHPARLSEILNGKKGISSDYADRVATKLGLIPSDHRYFLTLVEAQHARSKVKRNQAIASIKAHRKSQGVVLSHDVYKVVSDWYHYAILESTFLKNFECNTKNLSRFLGITKFQTKEAIKRLLRLNLLAEDGEGQLSKTESFITTSVDIPSDEIVKMNRQLLEKAGQALDHDVRDRDFSTVTFAIDPARIPEAKEILADCRRNLIALLESGDQTELYCLSTQLFRLSEIKNETQNIRTDTPCQKSMPSEFAQQL